MDELNKRIIEIMIKMDMSKSSFAKALDISLPLITHITTGRNKPGLDLVQKILVNFKQINPNWLLLGVGEMYISEPLKHDITPLFKRINSIEIVLDEIENTHKTVSTYHKMLYDEIMHLSELSNMLKNSSFEIQKIKDELKILKQDLDFN